MSWSEGPLLWTLLGKPVPILLTVSGRGADLETEATSYVFIKNRFYDIVFSAVWVFPSPDYSLSNIATITITTGARPTRPSPQKGQLNGFSATSKGLASTTIVVQPRTLSRRRTMSERVLTLWDHDAIRLRGQTVRSDFQLAVILERHLP